MYDSDNIDDIPDNARIVAYYNDGEAGTATPTQLARFIANGTVLVSITRRYGVRAKVIDYESGAATLSNVIDQIDNHLSDTVYASYDMFPYINNVLPGRVYNKWCADYSMTAIPPGFVGIQFAGSPGASPGHYDLSYIVDSGWPENGGNTPVTQVYQPPVGLAITPSGNGYWIMDSDGGVFTFGDAGYYGSLPSLVAKGEGPFTQAISFTPTITGKGYYIQTVNHGVFAFGDAIFRGYPGAKVT